jgi:hypothetical protein
VPDEEIRQLFGSARRFFIEFGFERVDFVTERQPDYVPLLLELDRGCRILNHFIQPRALCRSREFHRSPQLDRYAHDLDLLPRLSRGEALQGSDDLVIESKILL